MTDANNPARKIDVLEDVERLSEWLMKQPHLPKDIDDAVLEAFVRGTKSLEIAKKKLDSYYFFRGRFPQLFDFSNRDPTTPAFQEASKAVCMYFLPKPTPEGYRVLMMGGGEDLVTFNNPQMLVRALMMIELAMTIWPDMTGIVFCYDLKHVPRNFIKYLNLTLYPVAIHWFQSSVPSKVKRAIVINSPSWVHIITNTVAKPFLSEKMFNRIIISTNGEEVLKQYIPPEILTSDYGGNEKSSDQLNVYWLDLLVEKRDWFIKTSGQTSDESKRPPDSSDAYGVEGTFRALSFD